MHFRTTTRPTSLHQNTAIFSPSTPDPVAAISDGLSGSRHRGVPRASGVEHALQALRGLEVRLAEGLEVDGAQPRASTGETRRPGVFLVLVLPLVAQRAALGSTKLQCPCEKLGGEDFNANRAPKCSGLASGWKPDAPENKKTRRPHFGVSALRDRPSTAPASTVAAAFSTFSKASLARAWMERWQCRELLSCPVLPGSCPSLHRLSKQNRPRLQLLGRLIWMDLQCQLLVAGPRAFAINGVLVGPTTSVEVGVGNRELGKWGGWLGHGWA